MARMKKAWLWFRIIAQFIIGGYFFVGAIATLHEGIVYMRGAHSC
jgi:hypothetical protein